MKLNRYIDHTKLGFLVDKSTIDNLIKEAIEYDFFSICIPPHWVSYAKDKLRGTNTAVCTVIGFPHGNHLPKVKLYEAKLALENGADELDMVINVIKVKERDEKFLVDEIKSIVDAAGGKIVKVIIETSQLNHDDIIFASEVCVLAGAHFVKTSTGYGDRGASFEDIKLIKETVGNRALIKASGGVRTYADAMKMIELGANRIGTSRGVSLIKDIKDDKEGY